MTKTQTNNKGGKAKPQAPPQAWSRIEGSIWIPGHNPRSHIGHLILILALGPRSETEKGAPSPLPPPCLCRCLGSRQFGPWKNTHYPDIITKIYVEPYR